MKRLLMAFAFLLCVFPYALSFAAQAAETKAEESTTTQANEAPPDFRNVRWGMSVAEVREREPRKPNAEHKEAIGSSSYIRASLMYEVKVGTHKMNLLYSFMDNKLFMAAYFLDEDFTNKNNYVEAYEQLVSALKEKYGTPQQEETSWSNDLLKNTPGNLGLAYSRGDVLSFAEWHHKGTNIAAMINGNNHEIDVFIKYHDDAVYAEYEKLRKQKVKSDL
ncbi:hypothetical protein [Desulfovibrio cuneatus]|uniref:hypothetical protein n=1 Tax=Desulfovibrio cuneatus TaxID=159728 RepID=UPI00048481F7|nr:hypothetical protein [Desulfovibrio cuneatus]